jgi:tRNA nucleotidyltransferase (CCA-adding enzyme)
MEEPNLIGKLRECLPTPVRTLLDRLIGLGDSERLSLYLVGGPLRDLLLDQPSRDLDIAVEGDAIALARQLSGLTRSRVVTHPRFGTATVRPEDVHLDLITARSESYSRPGALPTVKPGTIEDDLRRRDFTINALALLLTGRDSSQPLDPTGGLADIDARLIRILHDRSFQDDATRILRAFRYAARLGFGIEYETLAWLSRDLRYLETISGARLHREFGHIFAEQTPEDIVLPLHETGALCEIHPALRFAREHAEAFARLRELHPSGARAAYWPVLAWRLTASEATSLARRLATTKPQRQAILGMATLGELAPNLRRGELKRSAIAETLSSYPVPTLWAFAALSEDFAIRDRVLEYLTRARHERPYLTGEDLLALGVPEGPKVGEVLRRLRNAHLDGEVTSGKEEENLARRLAGQNEKTHHRSKKTPPSRSS